MLGHLVLNAAWDPLSALLGRSETLLTGHPWPIVRLNTRPAYQRPDARRKDVALKQLVENRRGTPYFSGFPVCDVPLVALPYGAAFSTSSLLSTVLATSGREN